MYLYDRTMNHGLSPEYFEFRLHARVSPLARQTLLS